MAVTVRYRWLPFAFLMAAFACYLIGMMPGFSVLLGLGLGFELFFWLRLFRGLWWHHHQG